MIFRACRPTTKDSKGAFRPTRARYAAAPNDVNSKKATLSFVPSTSCATGLLGRMRVRNLFPMEVSFSVSFPDEFEGGVLMRNLPDAMRHGSCEFLSDADLAAHLVAREAVLQAPIIQTAISCVPSPKGNP